MGEIFLRFDIEAIGADAVEEPEAKRIDLKRSGLPLGSSEIQGVSLWKEVDPLGENL